MQRLTSDAVIEVLDKVVFACGAVFYNDFNIGHGHICKQILILNSLCFILG
jgi:hypothetical protein